MSEANQVNPINEVALLQESVNPKILDALFTRLDAGDIEQFYQSYQSWVLQQQRVDLLRQIATLQHKVMQHAEQMQGLAPSALALASLTQLRAYGVEDIDLLERMLERGEVWLDHTIQLLIRCEQLDVIGSNYTEWCEHALEGAYDWIDSIGEDTDETSVTLAGVEQGGIDATADISAQITEELILQKLMSDDEDADQTERVLAVDVSRITQPLSMPDNEYIEVPNSAQELEVVPMAEQQLSTEAICEIREIEEKGEERQGELVGVAIEPTDTQNNLAEGMAVIQTSEVLPDPLANDQLASSSLDAESTEISPGTQANQLSTELFLDVQPIESMLANGQQAEEAEYAFDLVEELQASIPMSTEIEQADLLEPVVQEQTEEVAEAIEIPEEEQADVPMSTEVEQADLLEPAVQEQAEEVAEAIEIPEEEQADVPMSTEVEQADLAEPAVQEQTEEVDEVIDIAEGLQAGVPMSTEVEQADLAEPAVQGEVGEVINPPEEEQTEVSMHTEGESVDLVEPVAQEQAKEVEGTINIPEGLQADMPMNIQLEQASLIELAPQITEQELAKAPEPSPVYDGAISLDNTANSAEQAVVLEDSNVYTQEEEKPRQEVLPSKRGFLRRLLARIWHR